MFICMDVDTDMNRYKHRVTNRDRDAGVDTDTQTDTDPLNVKTEANLDKTWRGIRPVETNFGFQAPLNKFPQGIRSL